MSWPVALDNRKGRRVSAAALEILVSYLRTVLKGRHFSGVQTTVTPYTNLDCVFAKNTCFPANLIVIIDGLDFYVSHNIFTKLIWFFHQHYKLFTSRWIAHRHGHRGWMEMLLSPELSGNSNFLTGSLSYLPIFLDSGVKRHSKNNNLFSFLPSCLLFLVQDYTMSILSSYFLI